MSQSSFVQIIFCLVKNLITLFAHLQALLDLRDHPQDPGQSAQGWPHHHLRASAGRPGQPAENFRHYTAGQVSRTRNFFFVDDAPDKWASVLARLVSLT
jgi:hypothetical protein